MTHKKITYKDSGIDLEAASRLVRNIQPLSERSYRKEVISGIGGFAGLFNLKGYQNPVLVSATDGVGTKLLVAERVEKYKTVGIDLVAMCVNDIITCGAEPLFFLDYFSAGKLDVKKATNVINGIVDGCKIAGCSLIGGETAELPGIFDKDKFDLAGFVVGAVEKNKIIDSRFVDTGDSVIGIASSGLHSNGYSLARKLFFEDNNFSPYSYIEPLNKPLCEELLEPTKIYVKPILSLINEHKIKSIVHITGGGFIDNFPRNISHDFQVNIYPGQWDVPPIFNIIENMSGLNKKEMFNVFNMGIGMAIVVENKESDEIISKLNNMNYPSFLIGNISARKHNERVILK